tara:strand:+ start:76 stop:480 length:405 start_codon:yes stop_codon:yes gene_type:complete
MWNSIIDFFTGLLLGKSQFFLVIVVYNFFLWLIYTIAVPEPYSANGIDHGVAVRGLTPIVLAPLWETTEPAYNVFMIGAAILQAIIYGVIVIGYILLFADDYMKKRAEKKKPEKEELTNVVPFSDDYYSNTLKF